MAYPFSSILLNQREVGINDILNASVHTLDDFEKETCRFIRAWLQGQDEFELTTSGSTGTPKPIVVKRHQMEASALATAQALELNSGERSLLCLDPRFIAGKMMIVRALITGLYIEAVSPSANPLQNVGWGKIIHFVAFVPYQLHSILSSADAGKLNSVRKIIVGGAPLSGQVATRLDDFECEVYLTYGMTETVSHIALRRVNGPEKSNLFHTLPAIEIGVDERSCLIIRSPYISGKVITNDIVYIHNQTTFEWIGRADNVLNSGGVKISPEEIERKIEPILRRLNFHGRYVISSVPDDAFGEKLALILEIEHLDEGAKRRIADSLSQLLPKFQTPKTVECVQLFPETQSGKVNRRQIKLLLTKRL